MFTVYRINTVEAKGNSHGIGTRAESWTLVKDSVFETEELAKERVRTLNRVFSEMIGYTSSMKTQIEKDNFIEEFCFERHFSAILRWIK